MSDDLDKEIDAIRSVLSALEPLSPKVRMSVLNYVTSRLEMSLPTATVKSSIVAPTTSATSTSTSTQTPPSGSYEHIKDLKEAKKPKSNNEMAALVAYFLAHDAPPGEQKDTINQQDIETYFRIAEYPLPEQPRLTLTNAKAAGYLDMAGGGEYRLNPVGYNLVKHSLPRTGTSSPRRKKKKVTRKKAAKKKKKFAKKRSKSRSKKKASKKKKKPTG